MERQRHLERRETLAYWPAEAVENGEAVGLVTNLNEAGIQIHSAHGFLKGQKLAIRITVDVAQAGTDHISLSVENVWSSRSSVAGLYHAGFRIIDISDSARLSVRALIEAFSYTSETQ
jgi:hypothetical protein